MKFREFLNEDEAKDLVALEPLDPRMHDGFVTNIEQDTLDNSDYRKVLYTSEFTQLVLMSVKPGDYIEMEVHDGAQFFRVEAGSGVVIINGKKHPISDGSGVVVPVGTKHKVMNTGQDDLKLYTLYSPPQHDPKTVQKDHPSKDAEEKDIPLRKK